MLLHGNHMYQCRYEKLIVLINALTKRKILIKNNISPPHENGEGDSRRIIMSVTAAISPNEHCCQIAENSAKKLKYSGRKTNFTAKNWSGTLAEIAEK
jgi:hypothetical protein